MLSYVFTVAQETIRNQNFQSEVLRSLLLIYERRQSKTTDSNFDYFKIAKCQFHLNLPNLTSSLFEKLLLSEVTDDQLTAYQIAFDLVDKEQQAFTSQVINQISNLQNLQKDRQAMLLSILKGDVRERLTLQFLKKNNYADMLMVGKIKDAMSSKVQHFSMLHGATIWMNGIMNAYTANDTFAQDNMNWVAQATNWNRFTSVATLGMIHMYHKGNSDAALGRYMAQGPEASSYARGGAYFAHGLINANQQTGEVVRYYMDGYDNAGDKSEVYHGLSLGLGLVGMATKD